jgi:uncharacterized protein YegL
MEFANNQNNQNNQNDQVNSVPLENVNIIGYMMENLGKINYELMFSNSASHTINPIHYFALDPKATICKFTMMIGKTVLMGKVQEKSQAQQTYSDAQTEGKKTALIEKISDTDYKVTIGNVEPGQRVIIGFDYLIVLEFDEESRYKFNIPTNIGVKYFSSTQSEKDWEYECAVSKMKWTDGNLGYNLNFELRWLSSNYFTSFESNLEQVEIELDECLIFKGLAIPSNEEINLMVKTESKPSGYMWKDEETQKTYVLSNVKIPNQNILETGKTNKNFIFILDRSVSMNGQRIREAKEALKMFINNVPSESYFNVVSFGNDYSAIWSNSVPANDSFKESCLLDVNSYDANMGGTEIYQCLEKCLKNDKNLSQFDKYKLEAKKTCPSTYENVIIVLTDGDVGSINSIFEMVQKTKNANVGEQLNTRIFSFGLGTYASKQFIKGISDLTFGDYVMIGDSDDLTKPISKIIDTVGKQYYTSIELMSNDNQTLCGIGSVYPDKTYSLIYETDVNDVDGLISDGLVLRGIDPITKKNVEWKIDFGTVGTEHFDYSIIKQLYFNEYIRKLETSIQFDNLGYEQIEQLKKQIVKISVDNNIMNYYTSFVLVDNSSLYDVGEIGKDVVVPHLLNASKVQTQIYKSIPVNSVLGSNHNASYDLRNLSMSSAGLNSSVCFEEADCLEGGMDMFGGGGYYAPKYNTFINWYELSKLLNTANGSYRFEFDSWKLICYVNQADFDTHCTQVGMTRVLFYNFVILLQLYNEHEIQDATKLRIYFESKYPGLFESKKNQVNALYTNYINRLKTFKVWVDGDY